MGSVDDLQLAFDTSDLAAELALAHFESCVSATLKDDGTPVTEADRAVERLLRETLSRARPEDAFFGEELGRLGEFDRVRILDPIDGTGFFSQCDPTTRYAGRSPDRKPRILMRRRFCHRVTPPEHVHRHASRGTRCHNRRVDFDSVADGLYAVAPSDFVAARRIAIANAKETGDMAFAKELAGLRKPTNTGWALNMLVRSDPEGVERLLDLGVALRAAQQALRGDELRSLATQRVAALSALADRAAAAARERGHELSETVLREVGQSLSAALADPDIGADLRRGRMLGTVSYSGFGPAVLAAVPAPVPSPPPSAVVPEERQPGDDRQAREEVDDEARRHAHETARRRAQAVADAERAARKTASDLDVATGRAGEATRRVKELRDELVRAEQEVRFADSARRSAEEADRHAVAELTRARELAAERDT